MTTYTTITAGEVDQDSPVTQPLMTALRDNPLSIAETDSSAPYNRPAWYIEDGAGGTDPIYNFAVDGGVANITTPSFEAGYEYMLVGYEMKLTTGAITFRVEENSSGTYEGGTTFVIATSGGSTEEFSFEVHAHFPMTDEAAHFFTSRSIQADADLSAAAGVQAVYGHVENAKAQITSMRVLGATNFTGGRLYLYRRAVYGGR